MHDVWHKNDYREKNTSKIYYNKMMGMFFSRSKTSYNKNKKSASHPEPISCWVTKV